MMILRIAFGWRVRRSSRNSTTFHTFSILTIALCLLLCASANAWSLRPADVSKRRISSYFSQGDQPRQDLSNRNQAVLDSKITLQYSVKDQLLSFENARRPRPQSSSPSLHPHTDEETQVKYFPPLTNTFTAFLSGLDVMQSHYYALWQGTWPDSIDWTAAVLGTYIAGALQTLTKSLDYVVTSTTDGCASALGAEAQAHENVINQFFSQLTSFYFGQNFLGLRMQAYDDMLWVVLGWLDSIRFINLHTGLHYAPAYPTSKSNTNSSLWYGTQFIPSYAHRARLFYDLASKGWDTSLCGGGMIWNPYLTPYKNAITNELYLSASVGMYLYFPGDDNPSPFSASSAESPTKTTGNDAPPAASVSVPPAKPHDRKYLTAAIDTYKWLSSANMTNAQGLYADGYHISQRRDDNGRNTNTKCDERDEMVYTYNQGVLLSGLRGLWESTGSQSYLDEGHTLIESVIKATGWSITLAKPTGNGDQWHGLGRNGVLEDACDFWASCSQDSQTFKGIFFHHLIAFCAPLPTVPMTAGVTFAADPGLQRSHEDSCAKYRGWIARNAQAAYSTKDENGEFGMWWGREAGTIAFGSGAVAPVIPDGAHDDRNLGMPLLDPSWAGKDGVSNGGDLNDRGRGRTVETQGGGISVLRAMWVLVDVRA